MQREVEHKSYLLHMAVLPRYWCLSLSIFSISQIQKSRDSQITKIRGQAQNAKTRGNLRSSCLLGIGLLLLSRRQRPKQRTSVVRAAAFDRVASRTTRAPARPRGPDCPRLLSVAGPISLPILPFFSICTIKRLSRILATRHRSHFHVTV